MKKFPSLSELADWYYYAADLAQESDELRPEGYWESAEGIKEVLVRAFASSDCGDFAVMLHEMTGYPLVNLLGPDGFPIHTFVRSPDGRALDVLGLFSDQEIAQRYRFSGSNPPLVHVTPELACGHLPSDEWTEEGFDERACRLAAVIRQLPWAPYDSPDFQVLTQSPLVGVDYPDGDLPEASPSPPARKPSF